MFSNIKNIDKISIEKFNSFIIKVLENSNKVKNEDLLISYSFDLSSVSTINFNKLNLKDDNYFYFEKPDSNFSILGIDKIFLLEINDKNNFDQISEITSIIKSKLVTNFSENDRKETPLFLGGMKFTNEDENELWEDYSGSDWIIPKFLLVNNNKKAYLIINFFIDKNFDQQKVISNVEAFFELLNSNGKQNLPEAKICLLKGNSEADKQKWAKSIQKILSEINSGKIKKAVLSRFVKAELSEIPSVLFLLNKLKEKYPDCYLFAYKKNKSIFFGASPEKLLKFNTDFIEADALAGSAPRGSNQIEDKYFETELLKSDKNLREHNSVIKYILDLFTNVAVKINYNKTPKIKKLLNIQHLWTPINIELNEDEKMFSILKKVHPTPAVCGVPLENSLNVIKEVENYPRGLYSGIIGWFNLNNEGEFSVAIRSALLKDKNLFAFAGGGIVEGSDPQSEFHETELKLNPILSLFENENKNQ